MACSVASTSLTSINRLKSHLNLTADKLREPALSIWHDKSDSATAATVEVTEGDTLELVITGGANDGTESIDLTDAGSDTLAELVSTISALDKGWVVNQHLQDDETSSNLDVKASASAYGIANENILTAGDNCYLVNLIDAISNLIEVECGRSFKSATYIEKQRIQQNGVLQVRNWPIIDLLRVSTGREAALSVKCTTTDAAYATVRVSEDNGDIDLTIYGGSSDGTNTVSTGSSTSVSSIATSISAVSGWTASVKNNLGDLPSNWLVDTGGQRANDKGTAVEVFLMAASEPIHDYDVDYDAGVIETENYHNYQSRTRHDREAVVEYTGGYSTIPAGLELIVLDIIKDNYQSQKTDASLKRERLGRYEYERNIAGSSALAISTDRMKSLATWCNVSI